MKVFYKKITKIAVCVLAIASTMSCNDEFLEKFPETSITDKVFFTTIVDLEIYVNGLYGAIGSGYSDGRTDNTMHIEEGGVHEKMTGSLTSKNVGQWQESLGYWDDIRAINFMLARTDKVVGDAAEINHYIGIARLFRAVRYYNLVKRYSDVPWYDADLNTSDTEELYKTQDPRTFVVDKIMEDLAFAVANIKDGDDKTLVSKNVALATQARIALHEGSYRKYHTYLSLSDGNSYFEIAAKACDDIIKSKKFSISTTEEVLNKLNVPAYELLFCSLNLTGNSEMIFVEEYDLALDRKHNAHALFDYNTGMTRDLMEDYLVVKDGKTSYFHSVPNYDTKTVLQVFDDRDPRLAQTFMQPGFIKSDATDAHRTKLDLGGYPQKKFHPRSYDQLSWGKSYTDLPIFRYAEVLLAYAEAKAELGTLTQEDLDITIKPIRERVSMPAPILADWMANIDPIQEARYNNVAGNQKGAILEIRRERRIELACEGFRYNDLMRWALGDVFTESCEGVYIPSFGLYDVTGDGKVDIAVVGTQADLDAIPEADRVGVTAYFLESSTAVVELSEGNKGFVRLKAQQNKYTFVSPKHYYYPLDVKDLLINSNLKQTEGWD